MMFERGGLHLSARLGEGYGEAVVFQHGLCGSAAQTAEVFPQHDAFRLATLECRGHGASELGPEQDISIATFADDVAAFIELVAKPPCIVGGISMGAAIGLRLAVKRPELVRALILARPAWSDQSAPPNIRPNAEVGELLANYPAQEALQRFAQSPTAAHLQKQAPDNLNSLNGFFSREPVSESSVLLRRISADGPGVTKAEIAALRIPVLVIGTENDVIHPLDLAEDLHKTIPHSTLRQLVPKGIDKPKHIEQFKTALSLFLEANP